MSTTDPNSEDTMRTIQVTVTEAQDGWIVRDKVHATAAEAERAIRSMGMELAERGESNTIVVTWQPTTRIGRMVVAAVTA